MSRFLFLFHLRVRFYDGVTGFFDYSVERKRRENIRGVSVGFFLRLFILEWDWLPKPQIRIVFSFLQCVPENGAPPWSSGSFVAALTLRWSIWSLRVWQNFPGNSRAWWFYGQYSLITFSGFSVEMSLLNNSVTTGMNFSKLYFPIKYPFHQSFQLYLHGHKQSSLLWFLNF